jgi:hypothetical protein
MNERDVKNVTHRLKQLVEASGFTETCECHNLNCPVRGEFYRALILARAAFEAGRDSK